MGTLKVNNIQSVTDGSVTFPQGLSSSTQPLSIPDGTVSSPSIRFGNDTDTGLYRIGNNDIGVSAGGSKVLELDPNTFSTFQNGVERFRIASNGQISSVIPNGSTLYNGFMCRAWVPFNGQDSTPMTIQASGNISSVVRTATGEFTISFLNSMPDANYVVLGTLDWSVTGGGVVIRILSRTTSNFLIRTIATDSTYYNFSGVYLAVFR